MELCGFTSVTAEKESSQCKKMVVVLLLLKFISKLSDVIRDAAALASCAYEQIQSSGENKIIVEEESPEMGFLPSHLSPLLYSESLESHICLLLSWQIPRPETSLERLPHSRGHSSLCTWTCSPAGHIMCWGEMVKAAESLWERHEQNPDLHALHYFTWDPWEHLEENRGIRWFCEQRHIFRIFHFMALSLAF